MPRNFIIRRRGKGDMLAAGEIRDDGTVEGFLAGVHVTVPTIDELEARCAELSSTGVDVELGATT